MATCSFLRQYSLKRWLNCCVTVTTSANLRPKDGSGRTEAYNQLMKNTLFVAVLTMTATAVFAQNASQVQKQFEAGQYQRVIESAQPNGDPSVIYAAAQSHQKLGDTGRAVETYGTLAGRDAGDPWHFVGLSGQQLLSNDVNAAGESARRAVELNPGMAEAHYQLGLVLAKREEWTSAATEFDRVSELSPSNAYAYYYGGLMHYRANRPDQMAIHFDRFLKLAPEAPERPEVMSIMRTVRGR